MDISAISGLIENVSTFIMGLGALLFLPILLYEIQAGLLSTWGLPRIGILRVIGLGILFIIAPVFAVAFTSMMTG